MFDVVLYEPEIPPNTGNVVRLAANSGARLHLVRPLGFELKNKQLVRAGLDYADLEMVKIHPDWSTCRSHFAGRRMFAATTRATSRYDLARYRPDDVFIFGPETRGLPDEVLQMFPPEQRIRVPMRAGNRSLNLSNTVAIILYEAWRQHDFVEADVATR